MNRPDSLTIRKSDSGMTYFIDVNNKTASPEPSKANVPKRLTQRLNSTQVEENLNPEVLKKDLENARKRRETLHEQRLVRVREHLARVEKKREFNFKNKQKEEIKH